MYVCMYHHDIDILSGQVRAASQFLPPSTMTEMHLTGSHDLGKYLNSENRAQPRTSRKKDGFGMNWMDFKDDECDEHFCLAFFANFEEGFIVNGGIAELSDNK